MTQVTANSFDFDSPQAAHFPALRAENVSFSKGSGRVLALALGVVGLAGAAATVGGGFAVNPAHAMAAWHVGATGVLAAALGSLFFVLVMHLTNAGWSTTIRRQWENIAFLVPLAFLLAALVPAFDFFKGGLLFTWMNPRFDADYLLGKKTSYLNPGFYFLRLFIYFIVFTLLSYRLASLGRLQDRTGDKWITLKARFTSSWGMLIFALCTAFAGFDLLMTIDFRFFSTMWGVYFFAGGAFASAAVLAIVLFALRSAGKVKGVITDEHSHDLGKLMFSFTVFWAYIAFSQYFLIWYSNIPEETAWFVHRKVGGWHTMFVILCLGHFAAPFLILIFRGVKRSPALLAAVAVGMLAVHFADMIYIIRPAVYAANPEASPGPAAWWVDVAGIAGAIGIFGFFLVQRIASVPLVPLQDPRLPEALEHKNYV